MTDPVPVASPDAAWLLAGAPAPATEPPDHEDEEAVPRAAATGENLRAVTTEDLFQPVFKGRSKVFNLIGIALWFATLVYFWVWWLQPANIVSIGRYVVVSAALAWVTLVPAYFIFIFAFARIPRADAPLPANARVAMVVTKAPSEPFPVVRKTLEGALAQKGLQHDTWLADEAPEPETVEWCNRHGVRISSRLGDPDYQRDTWPRRKHCKEGNFAYFYDHFGYRDYDFVSQFDADHVPEPDYLRRVLQPFSDPAVGYVSAPSICDSNARSSWSARGRLYVEASMHGALQSGYNAGWAPLCIGSHYAVRCKALRQIGGLGPELAEDHSTTLLMNACGWKGVHAVDAIAHGEGPETFTDLAVQEFQWSRSLVTILFRYSPVYVSKLSLRLRFQFLFSQLWYPMFSLMMAMMFALPIIGLATGSNFANVTYIDHFIHFAPLSLTLLVLAYWWRSTGLFRPRDAKILSWEGIAFLFLRWPWSMIGSIAAVIDQMSSKVADFRITPKGANHRKALPLRIFAPYLMLAMASAATALLVEHPGSAGGFYIFNLLNAAIYGGLTLLILVRHAIENNRPVFTRNLSGFSVAASLLALAAMMTVAGYENGTKGLAAMNIGITAFTLTQTVFLPAGAGTGMPGRSIIRFNPKWHGFGQSQQSTAQ